MSMAGQPTTRPDRRKPPRPFVVGMGQIGRWSSKDGSRSVPFVVAMTWGSTPTTNGWEYANMVIAVLAPSSFRGHSQDAMGRYQSARDPPSRADGINACEDCCGAGAAAHGELAVPSSQRRASGRIAVVGDRSNCPPALVRAPVQNNGSRFGHGHALAVDDGVSCDKFGDGPNPVPAVVVLHRGG